MRRFLANATGTAHFSRGDIEQGFAEADEIVELAISLGHGAPGIHGDTGLPGEYRARSAISRSTPARRRRSTAGPCRRDVGVPVHRVEGDADAGRRRIRRQVRADRAAGRRGGGGSRAARCCSSTREWRTSSPATRRPIAEIRIKLGRASDGTLTALQAQAGLRHRRGAGSRRWQIAAILLGGYYRVPNLDIRGYRGADPQGRRRSVPRARRAAGDVRDRVGDRRACPRLGPRPDRVSSEELRGRRRPAAERRRLAQDRPEGSASRSCEPSGVAKPRAASSCRGRGVGVAVGGWPGGVEPATAVCRLDPDGTFTVVLGSVDLNGRTPPSPRSPPRRSGWTLESTSGHDRRRPTPRPIAGGTGGSKITYTVGPAVQKAAEEARQQILSIAARAPRSGRRGPRDRRRHGPGQGCARCFGHP